MDLPGGGTVVTVRRIWTYSEAELVFKGAATAFICTRSLLASLPNRIYEEAEQDLQGGGTGFTMRRNWTYSEAEQVVQRGGTGLTVGWNWV